MDLESARALRGELINELSGFGRVTRSRYAAPAALEKVWWHATDYVAGNVRRRIEAPPLPRAAPIALGVGPGRDGYSLSVQVQDEQLLESPVLDRIRSRAEGEVDVHYVGRPVPAAGWHRERCRPLRAGASIGSRAQKTTGTLGCFVRPVGGGDTRILSNAHVLAGWTGGSDGDEIVQPGWDDGGTHSDAVVATLDRVIELGGGDEIDCATAILAEAVEPELPASIDVADADVDDPVVKEGRTTARTPGRVLAIEVGPVEFDYPELGTLVFDGITSIDGLGDDRFGWHGDSGSLIIRESDGRAVGLLFGVTGWGGRNGRGITYVAPLRSVLDRLGVELVASSG